VLDGQPQIERGEEIRLAFDDENIHAFDADGQRIG
jgi:hypothetical protein